MKPQIAHLVRTMTENEGVYICADAKVPWGTIIIVSERGQLWSVKPDQVLRPEGWFDTLVVKAGPFK